MYYTGFADEAGASIDVQIKATKELGWENIESRVIDDKNMTDISDEKFDEVYQKLKDAGIKVNCFGSNVANWGKDPRKEETFLASVSELERAIPRMHRLGTKMIRGMSFAVVKDAIPDSPEIEREVFRKVNHLVEMCEQAGIFYLHENCMNYGGMSWKHTLKLLENVNSPALKLVFDTGNPVGTWDRSDPAVHKKQDAMEFYRNVKDFIAYVHIKDGIYVKETDGVFPDVKYTYPGEGHGKVKEIVSDLLKSGYDGGFSMEPHLSVVFHDASKQNAIADEKYKSYVEYGKRFMKMIEEIKG